MRELLIIGTGKWANAIEATVKKIGFKACMVSPRSLLLEIDGEMAVNEEKLSDYLRVDGVCIAVPPALQQILFFSLRNKFRAVFLEKPLSTDYKGLEVFRETCSEGKIFYVDFLENVHPAIREARARLQAPVDFLTCEIGAPYRARRDMSPLFEYGPHMFSLIVNTFGEEVRISSARRVTPAVPSSRVAAASVYEITFSLGTRDVAYLRCGNGLPSKTRKVFFYSELGDYIYEDRAIKMLRWRPPGSLDESEIPFSYEPPLTASLRRFCRLIDGDQFHYEGLRHALFVNDLLLRAAAIVGGQAVDH